MAEQILKSLVGSRAHGLATENSDYDYKGVFVVPTSEILGIRGHSKHAVQLERDGAGNAVQDDVSWEVSHFLTLAVKCNPTILEVLASPKYEANEWGERLRQCLPFVWNPNGVRAAFIGYGMSQRKRMLDDREDGWHKYACAFLRNLVAGEALLRTGSVLVDTTGHEMHATLFRFKSGECSKGEVIDACTVWCAKVEAAYAACKHMPRLDLVDEFILDLRKHYWK